MESFNIVDEHDNPIPGVLVDKKFLHKMTGFHRAIHILVEVFGGKFLIQKKAIHTENGGKWSSAVSGHVRSGETYAEAAIREAKEELGLEINEKDLHEIAKLPPSEATANEFVTIFSYLMDPKKEEVSLLSGEVDEIIICPLNDLISDVDKNRSSYSPAFIEAFNMFLALEKGLEDYNDYDL
jgi:isopentenyldiphosphate isomerase